MSIRSQVTIPTEGCFLLAERAVDKCVIFLRKQAQSLNLPINIYKVRSKKSVVIITWEGTKPEKHFILLNTHMNVLPEAGQGVNYTFIQKDLPVENTKLDASNIFWLAFKKTCDNNCFKLNPQVLAGASDARYLRELGIPEFGFSPMNNATPLLYENNEYFNRDVFLKRIDY
ncbi:aminoacylase-1-like [Belonocnema kinseyi]|uniref:aminoacylase-1-like n=1 Tax=Belonocnema kinseyi TaxID=2817044 RepID=UPI00143D87ED|nr:aminoacylase-1-like [Belonocnema kinseyi]